MEEKHDGGYEETGEPDGVVGAHADPVGDGAVLALLLGQLLLDPEGLVRRLRRQRSNQETASEKHRIHGRTGRISWKIGRELGHYHLCGGDEEAAAAAAAARKP